MDNVVVVTLFRHGVTRENLEKRYLGWSNPPITDEAKRKLTAIRNEMVGYDLCISSDFLRCKQTADILQHNSYYLESKAFREMNFGQWELKTYAMLRHDKQYREWLDNPYERKPPQGEGLTEMRKRVMNGWETLKKLIDKENCRQTLLVTHGGVIRFLLTKLTKENKSFWEWKIPHGSGIKLCWDECDWKENKQCTSLQVVPTMENANG